MTAPEPIPVEPEELLHPDALPFDMSQAEARIAELARLKPVDYEQCRDREARALRFRVGVLDRMVMAQRPRAPGEEATDPFDAVQEWGETVDGAGLLTEIHAAIQRFCVLPEHSAPLMAAWVLHAWAHDAADISPVMAFVSPEKRCGKTTALSVISALVPRPMNAVNISASVLFRVVEKYAPTVLIDEGDMFLAADKNSDMLGMLNGGHNRLIAYVWRSVGDDHEPRRFKVWAPKVIAMIGKLPDTLEDRALVVHLRRKQAGETVQRFRADRVNDLLPLRQKAARWAADNALRLREADPEVPDALNDRAQDNARAICAIADVAGGRWPALIRGALLGSAAQGDDEPQSAGVLLLRDVAEVFATRQTSRIGSTDLCESLCALEEGPWAEWRGGRPISTRGIAKLLKPFGVKPAQDRFGSYWRPSDFADAFGRYLSDAPASSATSTTSATQAASATEILNENSGNGACGAYGTSSGRGGSNRHDGGWEGAL